MSWLSDLLGGEGPSLETRSLSTISDEQRAQLNQMLQQLGAKGPTDPNSTVAQLTAPERTSLAALEQRSLALAQPDTTGQAARGSVEQLLDFEGQTADATEYFMSNVQNPALDSFQREVLPQISRQFGGNDFFSSERQASEGLARRDLLNSLTAARTTTQLDQFNRSRDRALTAAGLVPQLNQGDAIRSQEQAGILDALGLPRRIEQQGLDNARTEDARMQELLSRLSLTPTVENIGMTNPGNAGLINIILGGAASGLGDQLGGAAGDYFGDLFGDLFSGDDEEKPNGESPADGMPPNETGTTVTDIPAVVGAGGVAATTPGGNVTITEGNGQPANQTGNQGGVNLGPATGGAAGAIAGQIGAGLAAPGGSAIITEAGGQLAAQVGASGGAGVGTAAGEAAGAAAGAPAGSGASIASGAATALAVAGAVYSAYGAYEAAAVGDKKNAAMSGAAAGAAIGSVVPVIGTAVGAVIGAIVGLVGASFGNKENPSELAYGSYKDRPVEANTRGFDENQMNGAVFEALKSHTKSGNVNRYQDMSELYTAFGITKDAHKNMGNLQNQINLFIDETIKQAQNMGGLPKDAAGLAKLDGQQLYEKLIEPAIAAKVEEATGRPATSNGWSVNRTNDAGTVHNILADLTDWKLANWAYTHRAEGLPAAIGPLEGAGRGMGRSAPGRILEQ